MTLTCTSSAVVGTFTGSASGTISQTSSTYILTGISGLSSDVGSLTVKWKAPAGQKFSSKTSVLSFVDVFGGTGACVANPSDTCGTFTVPAGVANGGHAATVTGAFTGTDGGATSSTTSSTVQDEATLTSEGVGKKGVTKLTLASGTGFIG